MSSAHRQDPLIGLQLANYRLEGLLGHGGMGSVYYAWDLVLRRPAAIKLLDERYQDQPGYAARFLQEARAVAGWRHPHIIQVYTAGQQEGLYYFAMEYVRGLDLGQILQRYLQSGELPPPGEVLRLGRNIGDALDYAHSRGVIHRDVKPSNILVAEDGRLVLTDFGLAMDMTQGSIGQVFGSPRYIAPEQARNSAQATPQSDLYSLAVVLYEMLCGRTPFEDPSPTSLALMHIHQPPPSPRSFNPGLGTAVEAVLLRALSKTPGGRYPSGAALVQALENALQLDGLPLNAPGRGTDLPTPLLQHVTLALVDHPAHTAVASGLPRVWQTPGTPSTQDGLSLNTLRALSAGCAGMILLTLGLIAIELFVFLSAP